MQPQPSTVTESAPPPELSVVVTTRDRSRLLRQLLESLDRQTAAAGSYEVVVVADGCSDDTVAFVGGLETRYTLRLVEQDGAGASAGRNAGAAQARGRLLLFVDDDELADEGLVAAHLGAHRGSEPVVVLGAIDRRVPGDADRFARVELDDAFGRTEELTQRTATFRDCFGGNCSLPAALFAEVGGYAVDLTRETDTEFGFRLAERGYGFVFCADAVVSEFRTRGWKTIVADAELRGRVAVGLYRRHPAMLPFLPLGGHGELSQPRWRRALTDLALRLRLPPSLLAAAGFAVRGPAPVRAWYSFVLGYAYWVGVRREVDRDLWSRLRGGTLILGYHAFGSDAEKPSRRVVPVRRFERQLRWLERRGYNVISLGDFVDYHTSHRLPPRKTVVISIDDGYLDTATLAAPVLDRFGYTATLFALSAGHAVNGQVSDKSLEDRPLIAPAALAELRGGAFEIGAHTRTHADLTAIPAAEAALEVGDSKRELERELGRPVTLFAYPFGRADAGVRELVRQAGFRAARGVTPGRNRPATDPYDLRWLEVRGTYSLARFAATLVFGELSR